MSRKRSQHGSGVRKLEAEEKSNFLKIPTFHVPSLCLGFSKIPSWKSFFVIHLYDIGTVESRSKGFTIPGFSEGLGVGSPELLLFSFLIYQFPCKPHFFTLGSVGEVRVKNSGVKETEPARLWSAKAGSRRKKLFF